METRSTSEEIFRKIWESKTVKQIQKELASWQKYMNKHGQAYAWHGAGMTPPNHLGDGDKVMILKEILNEKGLL